MRSLWFIHCVGVSAAVRIVVLVRKFALKDAIQTPSNGNPEKKTYTYPRDHLGSCDGFLKPQIFAAVKYSNR